MFFDISCFVHFEGTTYVLFYEWLLTTSLQQMQFDENEVNIDLYDKTYF